MPTTAEQLLAHEAERLRRPLLARHAHAAPHPDLEDIYAQSVLELLLRIRRDPGLRDRAHIGNALRQRFACRLQDRHRALAGRSPARATLTHAVSLNEPDAPAIPAPLDVLSEVLARERTRQALTAVAALPARQRAALIAQVAGTKATGDAERSCRRRARRALRAALA